MEIGQTPNMTECKQEKKENTQNAKMQNWGTIRHIGNIMHSGQHTNMKNGNWQNDISWTTKKWK